MEPRRAGPFLYRPPRLLTLEIGRIVVQMTCCPIGPTNGRLGE